RGIAAKFSISSNASVTARIIALCKAKRSIRISQQSLLGLAVHPYDFYTCLALVRAVRAGVDVQIVLSNQAKHYEGNAESVLQQLQRMYILDTGQVPVGLMGPDPNADTRYKQAPQRDHIDAWADLSAGKGSLS